MRTPALRLGMPLVVALALLVAAPSPALAEDRPLDPFGEGQLDVWFYPDRFKFCVAGNTNSSSQLVTQWALRIGGMRGSSPYVHPEWMTFALDVNHCETVFTNGAAYGALHADFGYIGALGTFFVHSTGGVTWDPIFGPLPYGADLTPY